MRRSSSMPAMIALAAMLCSPLIIEAQNSFTGPATIPDGRMLLTRAPIVVGASVYNPQNEMIGSIQDVVANSGDRDPQVVLSLGGFRGITGKLVEVPRGSVRATDDKLVIAGATKTQLMQLPVFEHGSRT